MDRSEFMRLINKTKKCCEKAQQAEKELFEYLENQLPNIDLEIAPSKASNADNIKEAITCYCQYGEYSPKDIWNELKALEE